MASLARQYDPIGTQYIQVCRPMSHLTGADLEKLHKEGKPVPMLEFTVVIKPK